MSIHSGCSVSLDALFYQYTCFLQLYSQYIFHTFLLRSSFVKLFISLAKTYILSYVLGYASAYFNLNCTYNACNHAEPLSTRAAVNYWFMQTVHAKHVEKKKHRGPINNNCSTLVAHYLADHYSVGRFICRARCVCELVNINARLH